MKTHAALFRLFAVAIGCALLVSGCRAHRQLSTVQTVEERDHITERMEVERTTVDRSALTKFTTIDSNSWRITWTFDTSKPVDPSTNLPPVQSFQAEGTKLQVQEDSQEEDESSSVEVAKKEVSEDREVDIVSTEDRSSAVGHFPAGLFDYILIALFVVVFIWGFNDARKNSPK